jgi:hypothetical protein
LSPAIAEKSLGRCVAEIDGVVELELGLVVVEAAVVLWWDELPQAAINAAVATAYAPRRIQWAFKSHAPLIETSGVLRRTRVCSCVR